MRLRDQRGEGRTGFLITLALFGIGVFLAVKIVPVRISGYQFREALREEARYAAVHREDGKIVDRIMDTAASLEIPLDRQAVSIKRTKREVVIAARYEQPIDLKFTTYTYTFDSKQSAPLF